VSDPPSWPVLYPVPPELEELPENPTPRQIIHVLSTTLLAFGQLWPRIVHALLYLKAAVERLERLPPMRRSEDTGSFIIATSQRVGEAAKSKAQQIVDDPHADLTPDVVGDIARAEAREVLAQQREIDRVSQLQAIAAKVKADEEAAATKKKADEEQQKRDAETKAKEKRRMKRDIVVGVVVGLVLLVAGTLFTFAEGRMRGFAEHAAIAPTATVYVQVPVPMTAASAPPPTGVGAAAPRVP
jgi:hypothetical protein